MKLKKVLALILSTSFLTGCVVFAPETTVHVEPKQGYAPISFAASDEKFCEISLPDTTIFENGTYQKEFVEGNLSCEKLSAQGQFLDSGVFYNADLGGDLEIQIMGYSSDFYDTAEKYTEHECSGIKEVRKGEQNDHSWYAVDSDSGVYFFLALNEDYLICVYVIGGNGKLTSDVDSVCSYFLDNIIIE